MSNEDILPARIRSESKDDFVSIGQDFVSLHGIDYDGNHTLLATKDDFDCRILSANVIGRFDPWQYERDHEQNHDHDPDDQTVTSSDNGISERSTMGPQLLVLVLETSQLVTLAACENSEGIIEFVMFSPPEELPKSKTPSRRLGKHCAVDPYSRAIAVAAPEKEIFLYSTNTDKMRLGQTWNKKISPFIGSKRVLDCKGNILLMDFLYPPEGDPDLVILLLVVRQGRRTRLVIYDWPYSEDRLDINYRLSHRIGPPSDINCLPNLLIPIQSSNAAFALVFGEKAVKYDNILTGSTVQTEIGPAQRQSELKDYPVSSNRPRFATWTRPRRNKLMALEQGDHIYIATEEGDAQYWTFSAASFEATSPGNLGCHVHSAFAPFGKSDNGDVIVVPGESSEGGIWMVSGVPSECNEKETWQATLLKKLPNWSRNFDLLATGRGDQELPFRSRNTLLAPSGRQPFGRITELRMGVEVRVGLRLTDGLFSSVTQVWLLPVKEQEAFLMLLSSPTSTRTMRLPGTLSQRYRGDIHEQSPVGLDAHYATLAAASIHDDCIVQVSQSGIHISSNGLNSLLVEKWPEGNKATAAAINETHGYVVVALRNERQESQLYCVKTSVTDGQASLEAVGGPVAMNSNIASLAISGTKHGSFVIAGTSEGTLELFSLHSHGLSHSIVHPVLENPKDPEAPNACDSILVLDDMPSPTETADLMLLCGLRSGSVYALELRSSPEEPLCIGSYKHFTLGLTTVKLTHGVNGQASFAACGDGLFSIIWTGGGLKTLKIFDTWVTDTEDPSTRQGAVTALAMVPRMYGSALSDALILISGGDCMITAIDETSILDRKPTVVPRSMPVQGSPHILIESVKLDCWISAATRSRQRSASSRTVEEVIEFRSFKDDWKYSFEMSPGQRVLSMMEWSYKNSSRKVYHFIMVATGSMESSPPRSGETTHSRRGGVTMLQVRPKSTQARPIRDTHTKQFDAPVYSIAPYGDTGYVACSGNWIYLLELSPDETKFRFMEVCKYEINSPAVHVSTSPPQIHLTTTQDSVVILQLVTQDLPTTSAGSTHQTGRRYLKQVGSDSKTRVGAHHVTLELQAEETINGASAPPMSINIMSTKTGDVVGLRVPAVERRSRLNTMDLFFAAKLDRSLMRVTQARTRPPWKPEKVQGVLFDELQGIAVDGTITGLAILDERLTNRLRWVQRLCERSSVICPIRMNSDTGVIPPPGFGSGHIARAVRYVPEDMAVKGDILQRLLDRGGARLLRRILENEAESGEDRLAVWVRENLGSQLVEVDTLVEEIEGAVDRWA